MELPDVQARLRDPKTRVIFEIRAFRPVTRAEAVMAIAAYNGQHKRKPKAGSVVTIVTSIGAQD